MQHILNSKLCIGLSPIRFCTNASYKHTLINRHKHGPTENAHEEVAQLWRRDRANSVILRGWLNLMDRITTVNTTLA